MAESDQPFPFNLVQNAFAADGDFLLSIIVRTILVTLFVVVVIRWMGHKGLGQLNMYELLIVIGLGTAIGDPMIYKELSLPHAFTSILVVVILFKMLDFFTTKSKRFGKLILPKPILIVKDGNLVDKGLSDARMNEDEYRSYMRIHGIREMSEIEESYLELNGQVSFIKKRDRREM
jgi:uncharacterized membrane protein YcaP (DUF421 family)